jgi:hypothetical protein
MLNVSMSQMAVGSCHAITGTGSRSILTSCREGAHEVRTVPTVTQGESFSLCYPENVSSDMISEWRNALDN